MPRAAPSQARCARLGEQRLTTMSKMLSVAGLVGMALAGSGYLQLAKVQAAGSPAAGRQAAVAQPQRATPERSSVGSPERTILDRYCVTCHNERLKTGGLTLDKVDIGDVTANAEVLEKIVRK